MARTRVTPTKRIKKVAAPKLSAKEQKLLTQAKAKIRRIQDEDVVHSAKGLTLEEARVTEKAGVLDPVHRNLWTEKWRRIYREIDREVMEKIMKKWRKTELRKKQPPR